MKMKFFITLILVSLALNSSSIWAGTVGKIAGRVTDAETGKPLPSANVIVEGTNLGAATDLKGHYVILNVSPGKYSIKASMIGYRELRVVDVRVSSDLTTKVDFKLESTILEMGKPVTVVAKRPLVQMDVTSSEATVSSEVIEEMPVEDFKDILQMQAGIVVGSGGGIHVRGGRADEILYMVDGIAVTDAFSGDIAMEVENSVIQELKVVSGTFNAEYGKAMSGVVDIVTKEGGRNLSGELSTWAGDYISNHNETFLNIDDINPLSTRNIEGTLSGSIPRLKDKLRFFTFGKFYYNEGWLYGQRIFNPSDSSNFDDPDPDNWYIERTGDSSLVPMNPYNKQFLQSKLTYLVTPLIKLSYGILWENVDKKTYNHLFKYNPDGQYKEYINSYIHTLVLSHMLGGKTFYDIRLSKSFHGYKSYVYKDIHNPGYVDPRRLERTAYAFHTGGTGMRHYYRNSTTYLGKFDITSQITDIHQIKAGLEYKRYRLYLHEFELRLDETTNWKPKPYPITSWENNEYTHRPVEAAFYIQDKVELNNMIINAGLRYDYFYPDGIVPLDLRDPDNSYWHRDVWYRKASGKDQISPRLGIAYPITDRGVIHFSYGHFFQIPSFEYLYHNPEFEVIGGELKSIIGNADLKPQKTTIYELGLQQQISEYVGVYITGYYKDIRNLLGTEIHELYTMGDRYARYVNRDYGNVRGVTVALEQRRLGYLSSHVDYTYQIAEGNASDPKAVFYDQQYEPPRESEIQVVPLDWDQTHTLNFTVTLSEPGNWGLSIIGRFGSGLPYTPEYQDIRLGFENSERKPPQYNFDLRVHKDFKLPRVKFSTFLLVNNLFDRKNENQVYLDTGRAGYSLIPQYAGEVKGPNTLEDFLNRPDFYSEPRRIVLGISVSF